MLRFMRFEILGALWGLSGLGTRAEVSVDSAFGKAQASVLQRLGSLHYCERLSAQGEPRSPPLNSIPVSPKVQNLSPKP